MAFFTIKKIKKIITIYFTVVAIVFLPVLSRLALCYRYIDQSFLLVLFEFLSRSLFFLMWCTLWEKHANKHTERCR